MAFPVRKQSKTKYWTNRILGYVVIGVAVAIPLTVFFAVISALFGVAHYFFTH